MTIILISLIILLSILLFLIGFGDRAIARASQQIGGTSRGRLLGFNYVKKQNELDNVDKVLERPVKLGKSNVKLLESDPDPVDLIGRTGRTYKRNKHIMDWCPPSKPIYNKADLDMDLIQYRQPYMYGNAEIINGHFYRDWRYPEKPINIAFLKDPDAYCKANPSQYPCFKA